MTALKLLEMYSFRITRRLAFFGVVQGGIKKNPRKRCRLQGFILLCRSTRWEILGSNQ